VVRVSLFRTKGGASADSSFTLVLACPWYRVMSRIDVARYERANDERRDAQPRDTERMKLQATIVISYRADSFGDAGNALDDLLQRAREREDVEIDSVQVGTPTSAGPVSIPYVERPPAPPQRVPHPLPNGERN
jgi:hypothetical protein